MTIYGVLTETLDVYRRLWRRSVLVAGLVFFVVALAQTLANRHPTGWTELVALLLSIAGNLLVQGALVEVVRDLHDGREAASIGEYYDRTRGRLGTLFGTAVVYALAAILVIPLARWALAVPLVVIERLKRREAFARSSALVRGRTGRVLAIVFITYFLGGIGILFVRAVLTVLPGFVGTWIAGTIASALVAPFEAHMLTVLYYKLTDPGQPVLPDERDRERWKSIWDDQE